MAKASKNSMARLTRAGVSVEARRTSDGKRRVFRDLVAHHYLPTIKDAAANPRKNTASHLGNDAGVPVRTGHCSAPCEPASPVLWASDLQRVPVPARTG